MIRRCLVFCALLAALPVMAQTVLPAEAVTGRLVVVYRSVGIPADAEGLLAGTRYAHLQRLGVSVVSVEAGEEEATRRRLAARPEVAAVLRDVRVAGHMPLRVAAVAAERPVGSSAFVVGGIASLNAPVDPGYVSGAGWGVRGVGGVWEWCGGWGGCWAVERVHGGGGADCGAG